MCIDNNNPIRGIPEVKEHFDRYQVLKRQIKRERKKINTLFEKFDFLTQIIKPKQQKSSPEEDKQLENHILTLFKNLGYKTIKPIKNDDLDVIIFTNISRIGIEVKNGNLPSENDLFQARKYAVRKKEESGEIMHPLVIWNNSTTNQEFDSRRVRDAVYNKYGILTTKELLKGFLKLKQGKITFIQFNDQINKIGLIKFTNKALEKMESTRITK